MATFSVALLIGIAVAIAIIVLLPRERRSSFASTQTESGKVHTGIRGWLTNRKRLVALAKSDEAAQILLAQAGSQKTVLTWYVDRAYTSIIVGLALAGIPLIVGIAVTLFTPLTGIVITILAVIVGTVVSACVFYLNGVSGLRSQRSKVVAKINSNLDQLLERVASGMRSGLTPRESIVQSEPFLINEVVATEVGLVVAELNSGMEFSRAMNRMKERCTLPPSSSSIPAVDLFVDYMCAADSDGVSHADNLAKSATTLREARALTISDRSGKATAIISLVGLILFVPLAAVMFAWPMIWGVIWGG